MQDIFGSNRRIGRGGPRLATQVATQALFDIPRAPLVMPTPFRRQNGIIDVVPSLLLSTLAITVVALPIGERSTDLAPRTPPKIQVQAEQQEPSPLQRGIVGLALPLPSTAGQLGPQQHYAVTFEHPPNLLRKILPDFLPAGQEATDSAPPAKAAVILENPRALIRLPLPDFAPIGDRRTESAPIVKYAVEADNWPSQLTTGIPAAVANPIPPGLQIGDSSPPKYAIQAQQYPTLIRVTLPDFAPVGVQLLDYETKPHYEVISLATPNLTELTLAPPAAALPQGSQISDSAPTVYTHAQPQIDDFQSLLGLNPPPPPVTPIIPGFVGAGGGGGGYRCPQGWVWDPRKNACRKLRLIERPHQHLKALLDEIGAEILYGELTQPAASEATQSKAAKLVRPFSDDKRAEIPEADAIDWAAVERDAKRTASLVKLWLAQQDEQELQNDDDEWMMLQ